MELEEINPAASWSPLQDRFYRKLEMYDMAWRSIDLAWRSIDLAMYVISAAPFGGPIALMRDNSKIIRAQRTKRDIFIYNAAGTPFAQIPWDGARIVGLGWSEQEELICVLEDGTVRIFDVQGEPIRTFTFGHEVKDQTVIECKFYGSGVVILTGAFVFYAITTFSEEAPQPRRLAEIPEMTAAPTSWVVIEPQFSINHGVEVLAAVGNTIYVVDAADAQDQMLTDGPYTALTVSPNGRLLAMFSETGVLWVVSTDFQQNLTEMHTKSRAKPQQLVWCGQDSVVAYWSNILLMVGPNGDWVKHPYDHPIFLVSEVDGVRIISKEKHEFMQKVPVSVENVFKIGSLHAGAKLYEAYLQYEKRSPKADEYIRTIKTDNQLTEAVDTCIEAAAHEHSHKLQRQLLQAASFGKGFLEYYDSEKFVTMCQTLRVLNAARFYEIGMPVTYSEYSVITPTGLIDRLVLRRQHFLAFRVCEYLKLPQDRVLINWACAKIRQPAEDPAVVCQAVVEKLANVRGISYTEIAKVAFRHSGPELATMLLDYEPKAGVQVPLLMTMDQDEMALTKAIESGDTELVYFVIMRLKQKMEEYDFLRFMQSKPAALDLFATYAKQQDPALLRNLYITDDGKVELAYMDAAAAYKCTGLQERFTVLKSAVEPFAASKEPPFVARAISEQMELYKLQNELEQVSKVPWADLSVSDTIYKCLTSGYPKKASDVQSLFKVPDRRFWWIKIRATADTGNWIELEKFAKSKKSPIGYGPFIDVCMEKGNPGEAKKYIDRLAPEERVAAYIRVGALAEAAEAAFQQKDDAALQQIRGLAKNRQQVVVAIDNFRATLAQKK
ncbi:vacuolar assembling/sorting protein VPS16 [Capsaspora owczarzaki ATCC 30864]|uniref:Vacuolar assembling/sorting protein VPS16 n=1 Tax=Capsaspora owczarzaki (strain ATCC 30864) TaxID=595528 RepID=A0A0D2WST5_CAPO3|nr:vacuolar assembling/sorting protein VPS16 [Capsaspora owczarzaki ATCC 30864]KJE95370.1 vacuolar assembling/sorting protein VPS16 [Capsaspora owczarzaki ATCC 30864]|eukprot:XP_004345413.1 vacuolar assembling/sorting protein VPS16 [Capsaspora owczarzaki ATCC 30864]